MNIGLLTPTENRYGGHKPGRLAYLSDTTPEFLSAVNAGRMKHVRNFRILGRKRSFANAGSVRFHYTDDSVHAVRRNA